MAFVALCLDVFVLSRRPVRPLLAFDSVLGWRDSLLDERIPLVTVRALPDEFRAAIAAAEAHVRIQIEDGLPGDFDVARHQMLREIEFRQRAPNRLVYRQRMRIVLERLEQQLEGCWGFPATGNVARERDAGAPLAGTPR